MTLYEINAATRKRELTCVTTQDYLNSADIHSGELFALVLALQREILVLELEKKAHKNDLMLCTCIYGK